jgi:hypothetical protein
MFSPAVLPAVIQTARDLAMLAGTLYFLTKLKPLTIAVKQFLTRATAFMDTTENTMAVIQSNHLKHIQAALETLVEKNEKK